MKTAANSIFASSLVLLGIFLAATAADAQTGKISVTISGKGKSGAKVEVSAGAMFAPQEKSTSKSGKVTFSGLEAGTYTVTPRKSGYTFSQEVREVTVSAGQTRSIKFSSSKMIPKVGMAYCVRCHDSYTPDIYSDWLQGPHGNFNYMDQSHHKSEYSDFLDSFTYPTDATQFTGYPTSTSAASKSCLVCHGPWSEDNRRVATFPLVRENQTVDTINSTQAQRPVIGCEGCHGGGKKHISNPFGRALTWNSPSAVQCGQCHDKDFPADHLNYHPAGAAGGVNAGIYEAYQLSPHTDSLNDYVYTDSSKTAVQSLCSKCHSDHGARMYRAVDGDATTLPALFAGEGPHSEFAPVQCRTCHDAHDPSRLLESASTATGTATARSAEFNTCTNCHQLLDANDAKITPYHSTHANSITTNHYDNPATQALEGYNVSRGSETACSNCHNPHVAKLEINEEYAESGHGELSADPWSHYDWKLVNRRSCQQCHTTTGFVNYVADPAGYNAANNNFSHLTGLQLETLYCNGCHSDSAFSRRTLETVTFPSGLSADLGDDSNLCMVCHQGRAAKKTIDDRIAAGPPPYTSFTNIHYLPAAASLFGTEVKGGYEYAGKTYVGRNTFSGHSGAMDTCVKCHMRKDTTAGLDHHFMPQLGDCSGCHTGITDFHEIRPASAPDYDGDSNVTEGISAEIDAFRERLYPQIRTYASGTVGFPIVYDPTTNPYWFRDTNGNGIKDPSDTTGYNKFDAKLLQAAYNYHTSIKEPGGFVHNHRYHLQLLFDSLEDLGGSTAGLTRP